MNLLEKIFNRCSPEPNSGCWIWLGSTDTHGYAWMAVPGQRRSCGVHHIVCRELGREKPKGMCVLHHCDNPLCVNPDHLYIGTHADNARDRVRRKRDADRRGEKNGQAKLTAGQVRLIRSSTKRQVDIAAEFNISQNQISRIKRGVWWRHVL